MKSMVHTFLALLFTTALVLSGSDGVYENAKQKVERIVDDEAAPGSVINLSNEEIDALVKGAIKEKNLEGVHDPKVTLGVDQGTWSGIVNFEQMPQLEKLRSNFLLSSILKGESRITATLTLVSGGGKATVDVKRVTIGDTEFQGRTLGFLVQSLVLSDYPGIELGEPFELEHNVEQIKLTPSGIRIKIKN